jgi:hypothetical protein
MSENNIIEKINEKIKSYPLPKKPVSFGGEYTFPEDISNVTSIDLGQWMFKLAAWKGYALKRLSFAETELSIVDDSYDALLAKALATMSPDKMLKKEAMIGKALNSDERLQKLKERVISMSGEVAGIRRVVEIYTMQLEIVSREISRRSMDVRKGMSVHE